MDTIVYKIHNLEKYPLLLKAVQLLKGGKGQMSVPSKFLQQDGNNEFTKLWFNLKFDFYYIFTYKTKANIPSSEVNINVDYNDIDKTIRLEFSLPKFYFGNNVIELLPPYLSKHYNHNEGIFDNIDFWYNIIKSTIRMIVYDFTAGMLTNLDLEDVSVSRLDICFNQIFNNQDSVSYYLDAQKQIRAKRIQDGRQVNYTTTLTTQTQDYYFKIYQKGLEFQKVGLKKIYEQKDFLEKEKKLKYDSNIWKSYKNADKLQEYSRNILRYELGCRKKLMSYLFSSKLNKRYLPEYRIIQKKLYLIFDKIENYNLLLNCKFRYKGENDIYYKNKNSIPLFMPYKPVFLFPDIENNVRVFKEVKDKKIINKLQKLFTIKIQLFKYFDCYNTTELKKIYQFYKKEDGKNYEFFLARPSTCTQKKDISYNILLESDKKQYFSKNLLLLLVKKFTELFESFQIKKLSTVKNIEKATIEYNNNIDKKIYLFGDKKPSKINVNNMKLIFSYMKTGKSFDDLLKSGNFKKNTINNYKKRIQLVLNENKSFNYSNLINTIDICQEPNSLYSYHYSKLNPHYNLINDFISKNDTLLVNT